MMKSGRNIKLLDPYKQESHRHPVAFFHFLLIEYIETVTQKLGNSFKNTMEVIPKLESCGES